MDVTRCELARAARPAACQVLVSFCSVDVLQATCVLDIGANNGERPRVFRAIGAIDHRGGEPQTGNSRSRAPGPAGCSSPSSRLPSARIQAPSISGWRNSPSATASR